MQKTTLKTFRGRADQDLTKMANEYAEENNCRIVHFAENIAVTNFFSDGRGNTIVKILTVLYEEMPA